MTTSTAEGLTHHVLPGLRPEPLASYLAGVGLIRVLSEQTDPAASTRWTSSGLAISTAVGDIPAWLAEEYVPTPVLSPWNNGSGFGPRDREPLRALEALSVHPSPRLAPFQAAIDVAREIAGQAQDRGWLADGAKEGKQRIVQEFRNRCPDSLVPWIDATVVLTGRGDPVFPPLLGTGGNDGRLDFSTNFHQRLLNVLGPSSRERARSLAQARDLFDGTESEQLASAAIGQFDPGAAGGPGSSKFGAAESLVNPWAYILLVEGTLLFAASAVRRNQLYRQGEARAAMPFTVYSSPDGSASGAPGEESRGEIWVPVWTHKLTMPEIRQLFAEARASWKGRPARRAADFYAATRTLGVARGIDEFARYGLQRRNGLAFTAVPLDNVAVRDHPEVRLAAGVDDWASRLSGSDGSSAVREAVRRFEKAHLEYARNGSAVLLARMLAALTLLEQAVGRSGRSKDEIPVRRPPSAAEFLRFFSGQDPVPRELRIAVGLASCATLAGADPGREPSRTMREILLPIVPPAPRERARSGGQWSDTPIVPGLGLRPLPQVLADVLIWRSRSAMAERDERQRVRGVPTFRAGIPVSAADLHDFARGRYDRASLDLWLRACLALDWFHVTWVWPARDPDVPVAILSLLHPLALGLTSAEARKAARARQAARAADPAPHEQDDEPRLALRPDWAARLAAGQVQAVHAEAAARLRQAGWEAVPPVPGGGMEDGARITAALLPRCLNPWRALRRVATPAFRPEGSTTAESAESPIPEEQS